MNLETNSEAQHLYKSRLFGCLIDAIYIYIFIAIKYYNKDRNKIRINLFEF